MVSFFPDVFRRLPDPPKVRITNKAPNSPKPITSVFQPQNLVRYNTFTDFYFNGNVKFDSCNFSFDYEPQDNLLVNYPRIQYSLRNPLCAPTPKPPIPPPPTPSSFYVGGKCNCPIKVRFAFYQKGDDLFGGAGIGECTISGKPCPINLRLQPQSGSSDGNNARSYFEPYTNDLRIDYSQPYTVNNDGTATGDGITLFYCNITFSVSDVSASGGWISPNLPRMTMHGELLATPWDIVVTNCVGCAPNPPTIDPPPPPKKKDYKCMCCPGQQNSDALLKLVLKRIGSLPADVPTSYLTKNGVQPAQLKKVESLTEFIAWFAERFDETVGEFEITIDVDDADLSKEGKQKETIRLPNLAESIAEMFSMMIQSNINNELILNIVNRTLIESGQIKQSEFKTYSALNALIDYVGFHTTSKSQKMPLSFTVGEKSFDKFLKESEQDVSVLTYEQKETLVAAIQSLLQAAAITRAVNYRRTSGNKEKIASTIKNDLLGLLGETGNITDQVKTFITNMEKVYDAVDSKPN